MNGLGLNLGCGPLLFDIIDGIQFINLDNDSRYIEYSKNEEKIFQLHDLAQGLPKEWLEHGMPTIFNEELRKVLFINMSQFFEHVNLRAAERILTDCYNLLEDNATIRISVPDAQLLITCLKAGDMNRFADSQPNEWFNEYESQMTKFALLLFGSLHEEGDRYFGHQMCYSFESIRELLEKHGFVDVKRVRHDTRYDAPVAEFHELVVEARKKKDNSNNNNAQQEPLRMSIKAQIDMD